MMRVMVRCWRELECDSVLKELGIKEDEWEERDLMRLIQSLLSYLWVDFKIHRMRNPNWVIVDIDNSRDSFNPANRRAHV